MIVKYIDQIKQGDIVRVTFRPRGGMSDNWEITHSRQGMAYYLTKNREWITTDHQRLVDWMDFGNTLATIEVVSSLLSELGDETFDDNAMVANYSVGNDKHAPTVTLKIDSGRSLEYRDGTEEPIEGIYEMDLEEAARLHAFLGDALERGRMY